MSQTKKRILLATAVAALAIAVTVGLLVHWYLVPRLSPAEEWQGLAVSIAAAMVAAVAFVRAIPGITGARVLDLVSPRKAWARWGSAAPATLSQFVGREKEIERLVKLLKPGKRVTVTGVTGMGGVGKTELVNVAAARVAERFRDGVLWAHCGRQDLSAIADLWAGLWGKQLPVDDEVGKAAAWRALVSGREALLVFDDVQPGQVIEPLFPAAGRSAVLITSWDGQHPALRGAERLALDQFTEREAMDLARAVLGQGRAEAQVDEAGRFFRLVGYLPLAVSIGLYQVRECGWNLATLNRNLEAAGALAVLGDEGRLRKSLKATFEAAWQSLGKLQPTLAALALFDEGTSFDTAAAAAVLGVDEAEAGARLERLAGRSLVSRAGGEPVPGGGEGHVPNASEGRWTLHALLRTFVAGKGRPDEGTRARLAGHYVQVLRAADDLYLQGGEGVRRGLALFDLEWPHIRAGQAWAAARWEENKEAAWLCSDYPSAGIYCLSLRLGAQERIQWLEAAVGAARRLGPAGRAAEGRHLGNLGLAYAALGEPRRAIGYYEGALAISRDMRAASMEGSPEWTAGRRGEGDSLGSLGSAYADLGEARRAIEYYEAALAISREICATSTEGSPEWTAGRRGERNRLGNLGNAYADLGQARRAIECHEQALAISREIGDRRGAGANLGNLGNAYAALGETRRAIECHEQALAVARESGDRRNEGIHLGNLGNAYLVLGEARRAIEYLEEALAISREIGDRRGEGTRLGSLGIAHVLLGDARRAIDSYAEALPIAREVEDRRAEVSRLGNLGLAYAALGEARWAIACFEEALAVAREIGDRRGERNGLGYLGDAYAGLGETRRAIEYYEEALPIAQEIGYRRGEGSHLANLGNAHRDLGEVRRAIEYYEQALVAAREVGDWRTEGTLLVNLGNAHQDLGAAGRAVEYYEEALPIVRRIGGRHEEGVHLNALGMAYADLGETPRAIECYEGALSIAREICAAATEGSPEWTAGRWAEGNGLGNLGNAYVDLGAAGRAIEYYEQALPIVREMGDRQGEGVHLNNLGLACAALGEPQRAIEYYEQALAITREMCATATEGSPEWTASRWAEGNGLGNLGNAYVDLGEACQAIEYYEQALAISRELGDRHNEGGHLGNLGAAYYVLGEVQRAIEHHEQALAISREICAATVGSPEWTASRWREGADLGNLGLAHAALGQVRRAIEYYEQALAIAREIGNRWGEGADLGNLGLAYAALGQVRRAIEYYEQALAVAREVSAASTEGSPEWTAGRRGEGNHLGHLGLAYAALGEPRRAIEYYEQALTIAREIGDQQGEANRLVNLGFACRNLGQALQAIAYYEQALVISREICTASTEASPEWAAGRRGEENALGNLGLAYADVGEARRAIKYYEQALPIARELGDRQSEGNHLNNLGLAYADLGEPRRAIEYYEQALAVAREMGDRQGEGNGLGNLGLAYADLGDARQAIEHYEEALAISQEIGDRRNEGNHLSYLGAAYYAVGEAWRAIEYFEEALAIDREIGDRQGEGADLGNLGNAYIVLGEARRAIDYHEQALAIAREIGDRRNEAMLLGNLGNAYRSLRALRRAVKYYEDALAITREIGDREGEGRHSWNLGLLYEESDPMRAAELMAVNVDYEKAIGHAHAEAHARRVDEIRARAGKGRRGTTNMRDRELE
jgi:tetratricopeptide (TPR) repeat protein